MKSTLFTFGTQDIRHLTNWQFVSKKSVRIANMATTMTTGFAMPASAPAIPNACLRSSRRRRITPQAGRALSILGHAIEYLTDEFLHQGLAYSPKDPQMQAVQLLMALNRQVYFECPEVPTFGERCRSLLHPPKA
jgi:hypothetical protein